MIGVYAPFGLIVMGVLLRQWWKDQEAMWEGLERLSYYLLLPCLLILSLQTSPPPLLHGGLVVGALLLTTAILTAVVVGLYRAGWVAPGHWTSVLQGSVRFSNYLFISIAEAWYGATGIAWVAGISCWMIIATNSLAVAACLLDPSQRWGEEQSRSRWPMLWSMLWRNPLILSCLIGLGLQHLDWSVPDLPAKIMSWLGSGALPMSLLCVGAGLRLQEIGSYKVSLGLASGLKFLAFPVLTHGISQWLGIPMDSPDYALIMVYAVLPCAGNAYILAKQLGGHARLMAAIITTQTLGAIASVTVLTAWLARSLDG
jgi:predicted permease